MSDANATGDAPEPVEDEQRNALGRQAGLHGMIAGVVLMVAPIVSFLVLAPGPGPERIPVAGLALVGGGMLVLMTIGFHLFVTGRTTRINCTPERRKKLEAVYEIKSDLGQVVAWFKV